jgi:CHAT domain-containing protein/tetratricopeptide (TPR) repeat protein
MPESFRAPTSGNEPAEWNGQATELYGTYLRTGDPEALSSAARLLREAVAATATDAPERLMYQSNLSNILRTLFEHTGDLDVIAEAVYSARAAVTVPPGYAPPPRYLSNLALALRALGQRTGELGPLAEAVDLGMASVAATPADRPDYGALLLNLGGSEESLGIALSREAERTGAYDMLPDAVGLLRDALGLTSPDQPAHARVMANLSNVLRVSCEVTGDMTALPEAIELARAAVAAIPAGDLGHAKAMNNLGSALIQSYIAGNPQMLTEGITALRAAIAADDDDPERAAYLTNLAGALMLRPDRDDDPGLVAEAADLSRAAVAAASEDDPHRSLYLSNVCLVLHLLSDRMMAAGLSANGREVLAEAVAAGRAAVAAGAPNHLDEARAQFNLSRALATQFRQTNDTAVLVEAVAAARAAAAALPQTHPRRAAYLVELSNTIRLGVELQGWHLVPPEALQALRAAVAEAREDDLHRAWYLTCLSNALQVTYDETGDRQQLTEAADVARAAAAAISGDDSEHSAELLSLGVTLSAHFEVFQDLGSLAAAQDLLVRIASSPTAPASGRIDAWRRKARIDTMTGDHATALTALESAVALLPLLTSRQLRRQDRERELAEVGGLGSQIIAGALSAGQPRRALELLEQARGLLLSQVMDSRTALAQLREQASDLAVQFEDLDDLLIGLDAEQDPRTGPMLLGFGSDVSKVVQGAAYRVADLRRQADERWNALIGRIRARPGLGEFLLPPTIAQLQAQADHGPIVVVNAAEARGDAMILTHDPDDPVRAVPLPGLTEESAYEQANRFRMAQQRAAQDEMQSVLRWLWDTVAAPIMDALSFPASSPAAEPRVWWYPVGVMSFLPLHAAGYHDDHDAGTANTRTVLDRAVSSYTTSIRTLAYARRPRSVRRTNSPALIVAFADTPGARGMPGVHSEVRNLTRLLPGAVVLEGQEATCDAVMDALPRHGVAHFACHGLSNWNDPGTSRLILYDHDSKPMTVTALSGLNLSAANLAYLSACSTMDMGTHLVDEAMHITAAFQLAGYRHVVGTLWPVSDRTSARVASDVYAQLTSDGTAALETEDAAVALHRAVRRLRADRQAAPTLWAPFIHIGM